MNDYFLHFISIILEVIFVDSGFLRLVIGNRRKALETIQSCNYFCIAYIFIVSYFLQLECMRI